MRSILVITALGLFLPLWSQESKNIVRGEVQEFVVFSEIDTTVSTIDYAYFEPVNDRGEAAVNAKIHEFHQIWMLDSSRVLEVLSEVYFQKLLQDFYTISASEHDQYNQAWQLEMSTDITPYSNFLQLTISGWEYAGGVHGNGNFFAWQYDRKTGGLLTLNDIFNDLESLRMTVERYFREMMELAPDASLNDAEFWFENDRFALNDNFFFRENEFVMYFNTYEISSYAMGPIEVSVPLQELRDMLILEF